MGFIYVAKVKYTERKRLGGIFMIDVLNRISSLQKERNWTNYRLAEEAALTQSTITNMFLRKTLPSLTTLDRICMAFGITIEEFFKESVLPDPQEERFLSLFRRLSARDKETVLALMEHFDKSKYNAEI